MHTIVGKRKTRLCADEESCDRAQARGLQLFSGFKSFAFSKSLRGSSMANSLRTPCFLSGEEVEGNVHSFESREDSRQLIGRLI